MTGQISHPVASNSLSVISKRNSSHPQSLLLLLQILFQRVSGYLSTTSATKLHLEERETAPGSFPTCQILLKKAHFKAVIPHFARIQKGSKGKRHGATGVPTAAARSAAIPLRGQLPPRQKAPGLRGGRLTLLSAAQQCARFTTACIALEASRHDFTCCKSVHLKHTFPNPGIIHQKAKRGFFCTRTELSLTGFTCFLPVPEEPPQSLQAAIQHASDAPGEVSSR